jgi:hypothetical protein
VVLDGVERRVGERGADAQHVIAGHGETVTNPRGVRQRLRATRSVGAW